MTNLKKLLSFVLVLVMVVSTMMIVPLTTSAATLQGEGTQAAPYLVGSKADLEAVATATAALTETTVYVTFTADVTLDAAVALNPAIAWAIDGANHTITTVAPLLATAVAGSSFKNLYVATTQTAAEGDAAGFVGTLNGTAIFENCKVTGTITATAGIAGGFVAVMNATKNVPVSFQNCINDADITATTYAGGFIARVASGEPTIQNAINTGDITTTSEYGTADGSSVATGSVAAGFIGAQHDKQVTMATIKNAVNTGTITPGNGVGAAFVGHAKSSYVTLESCFDNGLVVRNLFGTSNRDTVVANNTATLEETLALINPPKTAVSQLAAAPWDGFTTMKPALQNPDAANSAENPYLIGTAAELAYFSYHADRMISVDYWAKLTADINMGGHVFMGMLTAVDKETPINVTIDGDGYTIYNANIDNGYIKGFFKGYPEETYASHYVEGNLTLSNLHFACITSTQAVGASTGGVVLGAVAKGTTTLTNVTADATCMIVVTAGTAATGGLVGGIENGATLVVDKCLSEVTIVNSASHSAAFDPESPTNGIEVGGILGRAKETATVTITNSIGGSGMGQYATASYRFGAIVGLVMGETGFTFTNVFALSGLANVGCRYGQPAITNCYGPFEGMQEGNKEAIAAICMAARNVTEHFTGSASCVNVCEVCSMRLGEHVWDNVCDTTCNTPGCEYVRMVPHVWTNDCDTDCNTAGCGVTRTIPDNVHVWTNVCDTVCDTEGCGATRSVDDAHVWTDVCDTVCDSEGCGAIRTVEHVYTNACDTVCDTEGCGATRTPPHTYSNSCDVDCNLCGVIRVTEHVYSNNADIDCNVCGAPKYISVTPPNDSNEPDEPEAPDNSNNGNHGNNGNNGNHGNNKQETTIPVADQPPSVNMPNLSGCSISLNSGYAVLALVALLGFAFVAKKKEN